jgi:hypothetical protein
MSNPVEEIVIYSSPSTVIVTKERRQGEWPIANNRT